MIPELIPVDNDPFNDPPAPFTPVAHDPFAEGQVPKAGQTVAPPDILGEQRRYQGMVTSGLAGTFGISDIARVARGEMTPEEQQNFAVMAGLGAVAPELRGVGAVAERTPEALAALVKAQGPRFAEAPVIDHLGNVLYNPIERGDVGGPALMLNPDNSVSRGVLAWHGSPYDFEKFDLSKIDTGEGAQVYGHGLYFAEAPDVARTYKPITPRGVDVSGPLLQAFPEMNPIIASRISQEANMLMANKVPQSDIIHQIYNRNAELRGWISKGGDELRDILQQELSKSATGRLYQTFTAADPEHFLDWDRPFARQSPKVQEAVNNLWLAKGGPFETVPKGMMRGTRPFQIVSKGEPGHDIHETLASGSMYGDDVGAANALRDQGILGIRYLDQKSRDMVLPEHVQDAIDRTQRSLAQLKAGPNVTADVAKQAYYRQALEEGRITQSEFEGFIEALPKEEVEYSTLSEAQRAHLIDRYEKDLPVLQKNLETAKQNKPTYNYVMFRDDLISVLKKYGIAGLVAGGAAHFKTQAVDHDPFAAGGGS